MRHQLSAKAAALVVGAAILPAALSPVPSRSVPAATNPQILFGCHSDHAFNLGTAKHDDLTGVPSTTARHPNDADIRLAIAAQTGQVTLLTRTKGKRALPRVLHSIEQGSSTGSGTGGRADTIFRGSDGDDTFTLFADYDSNGFDHSAALEIVGSHNTILVCDDSQYVAPRVNGIGRFGSTSIYTLAADGVAKELRDLPEEPDIGYSP